MDMKSSVVTMIIQKLSTVSFSYNAFLHANFYLGYGVLV